jgi:hypothetical protein
MSKQTYNFVMGYYCMPAELVVYVCIPMVHDDTCL